MMYVYSFYKFSNLHQIEVIKNNLYRELDLLGIKGTILISNEGINVSISQSEQILERAINIIKDNVSLENVHFNKSKTDKIAFKKLKVKVKDEIIKLDYKEYNKSEKLKSLQPSDWNKLLSKDVQIIDMRNSFEYSLGTFKNAINLNLKNFTDLKDKTEELNQFDKSKPTAIFCTGGIRCEKAGIFLNDIGFANVYQLKGGILNYLDSDKEINYWNGDCFVFDDRILIKG